MAEFKISKATVTDVYYRLGTLIRRIGMLNGEIFEVTAELRKNSQMNEVVVYINSAAELTDELFREFTALNGILDEGLRLYAECEKQICEKYN